MPGFVKQLGTYVPVDNLFVKQNGVYVPADVAYAKQLGTYQIWYDGGSGGGNPQEDLDYIEILNDTVAEGVVSDDSTDNVYGGGIRRDANGYLISYASAGGDIRQTRSLSVKLPLFIPQLNVTDTWLSGKGIVNNGATVSFARKNLIQVKTASNILSYDLFANNVRDNLKLDLFSNNLRLSSAERGFRYAYGNSDPDQGDLNKSNFLNRVLSNQGGVGIAAVSQVSYPNIPTDRYSNLRVEWRVDVDVAYNLTFTHVDSGLTRTINHIVKFRTYN